MGHADGMGENVIQKKRETLQNRFELFFKGRKNSAQAIAIFSIIVNCLNPAHVRLTDLTLNFASKKGIKRISLVDYVDSLLTKNPKFKPHQSQLVIHKFISNQCTIPSIFLLNNHFSK